MSSSTNPPSSSSSPSLTFHLSSSKESLPSSLLTSPPPPPPTPIPIPIPIPIPVPVRSLFTEFVLGGAATMSAALFTNPIEVVKTRMQVQGELTHLNSSQRLYKNPFQAFYLIGKTEGLKGLQGGLGPAVLYQLMMNGTRLGMYGPMKRLLTGTENSQNMIINAIAGSTSGLVAAAVGSPFFLIKVRLQVQSSLSSKIMQVQEHQKTETLRTTTTTTSTISPPSKTSLSSSSSFTSPHSTPTLSFHPTAEPVGYQHHHRGAISGLLEIARKEGFKGIYRGASAAMLRVGVGSGVQLSTYDACKQFVISKIGLPSNSVSTHLTASLISGVFVTIAMNPFDVVSTRMYNQPVNTKGKNMKYANLVDCFIKTVKTEGFMGLYKVKQNINLFTNIQ